MSFEGETMCKVRRIVVALFLSALGCLPAYGAGTDAPGDQQWPYLGNNLRHWGYSPAKQITAENVGELGLTWFAELPVPDGLVGNPLVRHGVVYQSAPRGVVLATDVESGRLLWKFEPDLDLSKASLVALYGVNHNRGLAIDERNVYASSGDCHVFALNRRTGKQVWNELSCDPTRDYGIIGAPLVGNGVVFVGNNNHELGTERGFVDAFDSASGKHLWRFYTVPGDPSKPPENAAMAMAQKSWGPNWWRFSHGAAAVWDGGVYDPDTGLYIFGTGNPMWARRENGWMAPEAFPSTETLTPANDAARRAAMAGGDWLFSSSIIAVNAKTGAYAWHVQLAPHDLWDYDAVGGFIVADLNFQGRQRHVVMQASKDGYFYVIDATRGECISANNYVPVETFKAVDPHTCRPVLSDQAAYWEHPEKPTLFLPGGDGAHSWTRTAYSPQTGLVYIPAFVQPEIANSTDPLSGYAPGDKYKRHGVLVAWDPISQKERWHVDYPTMVNGGIVATAGNLVFQGTPDGRFLAYAADTGKLLWSFNTKSVVLGQPSIVVKNGREMILVPAGDGGAAVSTNGEPSFTTTTRTLAPSRLLAFALGGKEELPDTPVKRIAQPTRPPQPKDLAARGEKLYQDNACWLCHGPGAVNGGGHIPDLRNLPEPVLDLMPRILLDGILRQGGMPQFKYLTEDDVRALQAYIINQAWFSYDYQLTGKDLVVVGE
jgi:PQQ-dependent dehydrogenase (methanol/ethanol family)